MTSVKLEQKALEQTDAAVILVKHRSLALERIVKHSKLVLDAVDAGRPLESSSKVVKL